MNKSRVADRITNRRETRANNSLVDSDIRDLGLTSANRGKVLRTPQLRLLSHRVPSSALRNLIPVPRVEISWGSDEGPDETILEKTVLPSESASSVELPDASAQSQSCAQFSAESSNSNLIEDLVASLSSSAGLGSDMTVVESAVVPVQQMESSVQSSAKPTSGSSISAAVSAPFRSAPSSSSASTTLSSTLVASTAIASGFFVYRDDSVVQPREVNPGHRIERVTALWCSYASESV